MRPNAHALATIGDAAECDALVAPIAPETAIVDDLGET